MLAQKMNFFGGARNYELEIGFYVALFAVASYFPITIAHLIAVVRKLRRSKVSAEGLSNTDLLDDAIDF